jgi:hypothetical protein
MIAWSSAPAMAADVANGWSAQVPRSILEPVSGTRPVSVLLAGLAGMALLGMVTLGGLLVADWREARHERGRLLAQVAHALDRGDRLHYVMHLVIGRVADLCPCTRGFAEDQYARALYHARTARQEALVTTERPTSTGDVLVDAVGMLGSGIRWTFTASAWLVGRAVR